MMLVEFENILKRSMGLDAASIGPANVERAVRARMVASAMPDAETYLSLLRSSRAELQELIEAVVVPETWFFRDKEAFGALAKMAHGDGLNRRSDGALRLLSLPCSTGEEPYSIAMTLLDAGLPKSCFHIDAVDISSRALAVAENAVYGRNSFRGNALDFRDRYFTRVGQGYRLVEPVREAVRFERSNLFDVGFLSGVDVYDVIFCRNVLIYFGAAAQIEAVKILRQLLVEGGLLFVGPAETGLLFERGFVSAKVPLAFAFRKDTVHARRAVPGNAPAGRVWPSRHRGGPAKPSPVRTGARVASPEVAVPQHIPISSALSIEEIERLADEGRFGEAAQECRKYLHDSGPSAQVFHLMGLICDAGGHVSEAADYYRKALYLEPHHPQSLLHLSLLLGKRGDRAAARVLDERLSRAVRKGAGA